MVYKGPSQVTPLQKSFLFIINNKHIINGEAEWKIYKPLIDTGLYDL